jgi:predicted nicotinamide N-methyase
MSQVQATAVWQTKQCSMPLLPSGAKPVQFDEVHTLPLSNGITLNIQHSAQEVMDMRATGASLTHRGDWWPGCSIWESADILAKLLSAEPERIRDKRVLELGAGCGLSGLAAGALGAKEVTLSDEVMFLAALNLDANFLQKPELHHRFKLSKLRWGDKEHIAASGPPYDVILASDVLYEGEQHDIFADTLIGLSGPGTHIYLATPEFIPTDNNYATRRFYQRLRDGGLDVSDMIQEDPFAKKARIFKQERYLERGPVSIVEISMDEKSDRVRMANRDLDIEHHTCTCRDRALQRAFPRIHGFR